MSGRDKSGLIGFTFGIGLTFLVIWLINRDKAPKEVQPPVSDESISVAVEAYSKAMSEGQSKENMDELNNQLKSEFGVTIKYSAITGKFTVMDKSGNKIKDV
jgi:hypothetical protein